MNYKNIALVAVGVVVLVVITIIAYNQSMNNRAPLPVGQGTEEQIEPQKTDFGTQIPSDFPTDIPFEEGAKVEQSYGIDYSGQKQLTVVFASAKTVGENYAFYSDLLKEQNWDISNKYETEEISSLYGAKKDNDINVTISEGVTSGSKSQVSINILKK